MNSMTTLSLKTTDVGIIDRKEHPNTNTTRNENLATFLLNK